MHVNELTVATQQSIVKSNRQNSMIGNWEAAGDLIASLAVPKNALKGHEESFLEKSNMLGVLLGQINRDDLSLPELILLSQAAKAIEEGDTKAAIVARDTSGGKPIDKVESTEKFRLADLSDRQLDELIRICDETDSSE